MKYLKEFENYSHLTSEQNSKINDLKEIEPLYKEFSNDDIQYAINNLVPDSKVKSVVFHGSRYIFDEFRKTDVNILGWKLNRGTYFSDSLTHAKHFTVGKGRIYAAIINITTPYSASVNHVLFNSRKGDGLIHKNFNDANIGVIDQYTVFNPSQITILNSPTTLSTIRDIINGRHT